MEFELMNAAKETAMCRLYRAELRRLRETYPCVSAGRLAKAMGVSRATAKKYLDMSVQAGYLQVYDFVHVNGQSATAYIPVKWTS